MFTRCHYVDKRTASKADHDLAHSSGTQRTAAIFLNGALTLVRARTDNLVLTRRPLEATATAGGRANCLRRRGPS